MEADKTNQPKTLEERMEAYHQKAAELEKEEDLYSAIKVYEQILHHRPVDMTALANIGRLYHNVGQLDYAKEALEKVVNSEAPDLKPAVLSDDHYHLGLVYEASGWKEKALREYEAATVISHDNENARKKSKEFAHSIAYPKPNDPECYRESSESLARLPHRDETLGYLK